jgi:vanillate O-demethylase monooxygenase subunit
MTLIEPFIDESGPRYRVSRKLTGVNPKGNFLEWLLPDRTAPLNALLHTEFYNPSLFNASGPWMWATEKDGSDGEPLGKLNMVHGLTPETARSTHYFGLVTRDFRTDDDQFSAMLTAQTDLVRREDVKAIEAIESVADRYGSTRTEFSTKVDAGALHVRRILKRMIDAETPQTEPA